MKLQLLIPQYNETDSIMSNMLDSINIQRGIDLEHDIEVLIGNDGSDCKLSEEFLNGFKYPIRYIQFEHAGQLVTRASLFDMATADYVMFCDADDMFLSSLALSMIFEIIDKGCDALVCDFIGEFIAKNGKGYTYTPFRKDRSFVHGKVYRRQFLIENNIAWQPDVKRFEDGSYNSLALSLAKNVQYCQTPIYLWKWRDDSICRKDPLYVPKTFTRMIYSNEWLVNEFLKRGMPDKAKYYVALLIYHVYFMLNKPVWLDPSTEQYRYETEKCIKEYYEKYHELFASINPKVRSAIIVRTKDQVTREGALLERYTFGDWMKHIRTLE